MALKPPSFEGRWADRLTRSSYFFVAVLFHLVLFLMIATWIVWPSKPADKPMLSVVLPRSNPPPPVPPPAPPVPPKVDVTMDNPTSDHFIGNPNKNGDFIPPLDHLVIGDRIGDHAPSPPKMPHRTGPSQMTLERIKALDNTVNKIWKYNPDGDPTSPKAEFVIYVAAYADGDWNCNTATKPDGTIAAGGIPNLVEKIQQWSHGNMKASVVPTPLQIGSPDLLAKMPPFIFFTGHKDFKLTEQEVKNLQDYLQDGGAIWGDNALAGKGSRFDVAFRREMRRVVPDADKDFKPLELDHDIFKSGKFPMEQVPAGINYYAESIEHIDIDDKLAILYTPNDYSDLMFMRILPGDKAVDTDFRVTDAHPLYTNFGMMVGSRTFYRNFEMQSSLAVDHLGMDIITHLLGRFQDVLQFAH